MCILGYQEGLLVYELECAGTRGLDMWDIAHLAIVGAPEKLSTYFYVINGKCPGLIWSTCHRNTQHRRNGRYYLKWYRPRSARQLKGNASRPVKAAAERLWP